MKLSIRKSLIIVASITTIFSGLTAQAESGFKDVSESNPNFTAIEYLQANNVINGYSDGTFRPDQQINRAEFLKIIIEGYKFSTISTSLDFSDVSENDWFSKYVQTAYYKGWIQGYGDGTFRPGQNITKAEALKILAKSQEWQTPDFVATRPFSDVAPTAWYAPYIETAKQNDLLEETGSNYEPNSPATRAGISEVTYRSIINPIGVTPSQEQSEQTEETEQSQEQESEPEDTVASDPDYHEIATTFFNNVTLDQPLPNIFYKNEVYVVEGNVSGSQKYATVILEGKNNSFYDTFDVETTSSGNFSIPVYFKSSGDYLIGIIPGESGNSLATDITVKSSLPSATSSDEPAEFNNFDMAFEDGSTIVEIGDDQLIRKIHFTQDDQKVTYINRQPEITEIPIRYSDFEDFEEDKVSYYLEYAEIGSAAPLQITSAFAESDDDYFEAIPHHFSEIKEESISTNPPEAIGNQNSFSFSGTVKTDTYVKAYVIKPNGFVQDLELDTSSSTYKYYSQNVIKSGGKFTFSYNPSTEGSYILEINNKSGIPILNHPVYIGKNVIPLLPDYFDLHQRDYFKGSVDLDSMRDELLDMINDSRKAHGLSSVKPADDLDELAQLHAEDMDNRNYFSHINPDGKTPEDRRVALGISTSVSENIAQDVSIEFAHEGLMRSASHRSNILDPEWDRVGIGIEESDGYLLVVEEFSTNQLTSSDLDNYKDELLDEINDRRQDEGLEDLEFDFTISKAAEDINDASIDDNATLDNALLSEALETYSIDGASTAMMRNYSIWTTIRDSIVNDDSIIDSSWEKIGIDIQLDETGSIQVLVILNQP